MTSVKLYKAKRNNGRHAILNIVEPNGATILDKPTLLCLSAAIPNSAQEEDYIKQSLHAVSTASRITGVTGTQNINFFTVMNGIKEDKAKAKVRRNNDNIPNVSPTAFEQYNYNFARDFLLPDLNIPPAQTVESLSKRFSLLVISSFSFGGMEGAEILNACRKLLEENGFTCDQAKRILSNVKFIAVGDPTDMSFHDSGATVYRVLNKTDIKIWKESDTLRNIQSWRDENHIAPNNDIQLISTGIYPQQHTVLLSRSDNPGRISATFEGEWFDPAKGSPQLNRIVDNSNHTSASYLRHSTSTHGLLGPIIVQNLYINALNHAVKSSVSDVPVPVPNVDAMVLSPPEVLFPTNTNEKHRGLWAATPQIAQILEFQERIKKGCINLHDNSGKTFVH